MAFKTRESLDTNLILRLILNDIPEQCRKIQDLLMRPNIVYDVADLAITEAVYVLKSDYRFSREEIVDGIHKLLGFPGIDYNRALFERVFPMYLEHPKVSFNDCCLAVYAELNGAVPLWTFDRAMAKQVDGVRMVSGVV